MQKRKLTISLLLASFLLVFGFSYSVAQEVTFQSKNVQRCTDVILNVTIDSPTDLSAFELVFQVSGDYTSVAFDFASGLTVLNERVIQEPTTGTFRVAAMKIDAGDACLSTFPMVVGQISLTMADVCDGSVTVDATTMTGDSPCGSTIDIATSLVGCDPIEALATTVTAGTVTMVNMVPTISCPGDQTVHWGDLVEADMTFDDADLPNGCEDLSFAVTAGPGSVDASGHYQWQTGGDDVCEHEVTVQVTDACGATADCSFNVCVQNTPPEITNPQADGDTIMSVWGVTLTGDVDASDPDSGPSSLLYELVSFDGPGTMDLDDATGAWSWDILNEPDYLGDFTLCVSVTDGANTCDPCSPTNADTACYRIHVIGFAVSIEKVHDQLQGHYTTVSIFIDSAYTGPFIVDLLGGFDFLVAYDASALTAMSAAPGDLIDTEFEYFTYRFGPFGNCGSGCPSGMMRIVALREQNDGVTNPNHVAGPGELATIQFFVANDRTLECQFVPVRFFWLDCADNTLSSENGNWLYLGQAVYTFEGDLVTDPGTYGYTGPADTCFDFFTATSEGVIKNFPLGAIVFRNGGVDIICSEDIDARGDVNLNGIANEIADAVVFTNYFINGLAAFTVNVEGQTAATDINADGIVLSVADLVYLIRVIVGDALPYAKLTAAGDLSVSYGDGTIGVNKDVGAALFVFDGQADVSLAPEAMNMQIKTGYVNGQTRALVYSMDHNVLAAGNVLNVSGGNLVSVEAADYYGQIYSSTVLPTSFALKQNYPNPFNPSTSFSIELPTESDYSITIYNLQGQKVDEISGHGVGEVVETWDATGLASGVYFYTVKAGNNVATRKMMLLK